MPKKTTTTTTKTIKTNNKPSVKTAKKVVEKKDAVSTLSKTTKKTTTKKDLVCADDERSFWVTNGQILNSLVALNEALQEMEKTVFSHHVSKDKNDFAEWVELVLGDNECAKDLRNAKTLTSARSVVTKHLKSYKI